MGLKFLKKDELILNKDSWELKPFKFSTMLCLGDTSYPTWKDIIMHGNTALTLVNAKADGLNYLKLFGGTDLVPETYLDAVTLGGGTEQVPETYLDTVILGGGTEQRNIPAEYTQVEYLESSGTQYIDTGIVLKSEATITTVGQNVQSSVGAGPYSFWGFMGTGNNLPRWGWSIYQNRWLPDLNMTTQNPLLVDNNKHTFINTCYYENNVLKYDSLLDGNRISINNVENPTTYTSNTLSAYLFARNDSNTAGNFLSCRIFSYEIVQDGIKALSLIPCRRNSDNVLGMYDTVTGNFLTNAGTGTFTAGADTVPTPDAPMDIWCNNGILKVSPNLFNKNLVPNANEYINRSNGNASAPSAGEFRHSDYIVIKENTQYYVGVIASTASSAGLAFYDDTKTYISGISLTQLASDNNIITSPSNTKYIRFSFRTDEGYNTNWQNTVYLVEGNQPLAEFIPYGVVSDGTVEQVTDSLGNTASAERLLAVGDYKDTQEVLNGSVTRNVGIKVLDGTEAVTERIASGVYRYSVVLSGVAQPPSGTRAELISSHFIYTSSGNPVGAIFLFTTSAYMIPDQSLDTIDKFKQWLKDQYNAGQPVVILYPLETATTETVTGQFLSKSPVTQTAGSIDNLPITITESSHTVPTPSQPLDIVSNNGVVKVRNKSGLPLGYQAVEYLQSSSYQWLNTNVVLATPQSEVYIDCTFDSVANGKSIVGCQNSNASIIRQAWFMKSEGALYAYNSNAQNYTLIANNLVAGERHQIKVTADASNNITVNFDGTITTDSQPSTSNSDNPLYLFDNKAGAPQRISAKIYSAYIKGNDGNLAFNGIPCRRNSDNVLGMYDTVTGTFFTNQGTGTFTAGSDIDDMEIYTDGTQEVVTDSLGNTASAERLLAVGDYKDVQSVLDGNVTRKVGIKVLDGTELWSYNSVQQGNMFRTTIADSVSDNKETLGVLCNSYKVVLTNNRTNYTLSGTSKNYDFINNNYTTLDGWKKYLSDQYNAGQPVIVVYPLAESTTETVSGQFLSKSPVTQTAGSIDNLPIAIMESSHTTPTPQQPLQINCNNGVVKYGVTGKNLYNPATAQDGYLTDTGGFTPSIQGKTSAFIQVKPSTTYTLKFLRTAQEIYTRVCSYDSNEDFVSLLVKNTDVTAGYITVTFTTDANAKYIKVSFKADSTEVQLEQGSTATDYEPYQEGAYADGTVETVEVTGKNLWNPDGTNYGWIQINGSLDTTSSAVSRRIEVEYGKTYTYKSYSESNTFYNCIALYDENMNYISNSRTIITTGSTKTNTKTITNSDAKYMVCAYYVATTVLAPDWNMVVDGDGDIPYEPYYNGGTATAEMLLKVGDYKDVQSVIDGGVTRNVGIKVLDGSENWSTGSATNPNRYTLAAAFNDLADLIDNNIGYSNCYTVIARSSSIQSNLQNNQCGWNTTKVFCVRDDRIATLADWKQFLTDQYNSGNPVIIVYPLATATTESVTGQPLSIQAGTNIVEITQASIDNLELEVSYKAGVVVTITEIENAQLDNNVEVTING